MLAESGNGLCSLDRTCFVHLALHSQDGGMNSLPGEEIEDERERKRGEKVGGRES